MPTTVPGRSATTCASSNGFLRYSEGDVANGLAITALAYTNSWHATDQIPARAVSDGSLGLFSGIDPTDGGDTQRYSLSMRWSQTGDRTATKVEAYAIYSTLNLFNNFTYFLDNPDLGDQFQQSDKRKIFGVNASHLMRHQLAGFNSETTIGTQIATTTLPSACSILTSAPPTTRCATTWWASRASPSTPRTPRPGPTG